MGFNSSAAELENKIHVAVVIHVGNAYVTGSDEERP
jgi:hypothetical protein